MALTLKGGLAFGVTSVYAESNATSAEGASEETTDVVAKNADGVIFAQAAGNVVHTMQAEGYGASPPAIGADITIGGVTGRVHSRRVRASNEDFVRFSVSAKKYADLT